MFTQKAIYLLQVLGIDLRFRFSWYLRGPYSTDLARSVYEIAGITDVEERTRDCGIRSEVKPAIDRMCGLLNAKPKLLGKPEWLELLSSIHYLKHISKADVGRDTIGDVLRDVGKGKFSNEQAREAWDHLDKVGLINSKVIPL